MTRSLALIAIVVIAGNCRGPVDQTTAAAATPAPPASPNRITLPSGETVEVVKRVATLRDLRGGIVAENSRVIRAPGEVCPAEGFRSVESAGEGFRIRNQLCSGWFFVDEVMTFSRSGTEYVLTRFSAAYTDRRTAEPDGAPKVLTEADFGRRLFKDLNPDDLYRLLR